MVDVVPFVRRLGVYVHWPYCARACNYCAFNKYVDIDAFLLMMDRKMNGL